MHTAKSRKTVNEVQKRDKMLKRWQEGHTIKFCRNFESQINQTWIMTDEYEIKI